MIDRTDDGPKYRVYRKQTNKDDYIHYLSAHSDKIKSGIIIGFFLRAYRICSPEYLEDELKYIITTFSKLRYPKGVILKSRRKAQKIRNRQTNENEMENRNILVVPNSLLVPIISKFIRCGNMEIVTETGQRIGETVKGKIEDPCQQDNSIVYKIPCCSCDHSYYGESGQGITTRINQHKSDVRYHRPSNSLVQHIDKTGHLPDWHNVTILHQGINKRLRKVLEAAEISKNKTNNSRGGFVTWANLAATLAIADWTRRKRGRSQPPP